MGNARLFLRPWATTAVLFVGGVAFPATAFGQGSLVCPPSAPGPVTCPPPGPGGIIYVDACDPGDAGQRIQAAIDLIPCGPQFCDAAVIDARGLKGKQCINQPLTLGKKTTGVPPWVTRPTTLLLGPGTYETSSTVTVLMHSSIVGYPVGAAVGGPYPPTPTATNIVAKNDANLSAVVQLGDGSFPGGFAAVLQDLVVDGNRANNGTADANTTAAILGDQGGRVDLTRVTAQNSRGQGIRIASGAALGEHNTATSAKLTKVMAIGNQRNGLRAEFTNDIYVSQSEFENNDANGIEVDSSSALRVTNSDFGGNKVYGLYAHGTTGTDGQEGGWLIVTGNQFGNNYKHDLLIDSTAPSGFGSTHNLIASNVFIGSAFRDAPDAYAAVRILNSYGNNVVGNTIWTGAAGQNLLYAGVWITVSGGPGLGDLVATNVIDGASTKGGAIVGTLKTKKVGNLEFGN